MVTWGATGPGPSAIGAPGPYEIRSTDWEPAAATGPVAGTQTDTGAAASRNSLRGIASDLTVPAAKGHLVALDRDTSYHLTAKVTLPEAPYLLRCGPPERGRRDRTAPPWAELRFDGPAMLDPDGDAVHLKLPERDSISLSFPPRRERPAPITVGDRPADVARAISHADGTITTTGPERALPGERPRPPEIESGERTKIPRAIRRQSNDTGLELHLPESLEAVFVGAPLAYYLGATVTVGEVRGPRLEASRAGFEYAIEESSFAENVRSALRRVVYLDLLLGEHTRAGSRAGGVEAGDDIGTSRSENVTQVRHTERVEHSEAGERTVVEREVSVTERVTRERTGSVRHGTESGSSRVEEGPPSSRTPHRTQEPPLPASLDPDVAAEPLDVRVPRYFAVPDQTIDRILPEYHRTTATCTDADHLQCLPYLLDSLSAVEPRYAGSEFSIR